jgi:hypothetical protein
MAIEFNCPHCTRRLSVEQSQIGRAATCPACGKPVDTAASAQPLVLADVPPRAIFCVKCGQQNDRDGQKCSRCGAALAETPQPTVVTVSDEGTLGGLIPYKNAQALAAYYVAVFSLIPCAAIPLGIIALVLGIRGLKFARLHPEAKGRAHAWTGIILGGICALANITAIVVLIVAASIH